jgi:hypothetical protein
MHWKLPFWKKRLLSAVLNVSALTVAPVHVSIRFMVPLSLSYVCLLSGNLVPGIQNLSNTVLNPSPGNHQCCSNTELPPKNNVLPLERLHFPCLSVLMLLLSWRSWALFWLLYHLSNIQYSCHWIFNELWPSSFSLIVLTSRNGYSAQSRTHNNDEQTLPGGTHTCLSLFLSLPPPKYGLSYFHSIDIVYICKFL